MEEKIENSVFAFKKGEVNTDYMAGENLEPIKSQNPTLLNVLVNYVKNIFKKSK